jgi:hypothetical protein
MEPTSNRSLMTQRRHGFPRLLYASDVLKHLIHCPFTRAF